MILRLEELMIPLPEKYKKKNNNNNDKSILSKIFFEKGIKKEE